MLIIWILLYFLPIIVIASMDQAVAIGMMLLTVGVIPIIDFLADTREGKVGMWVVWLLVCYGVAANMAWTRLGHPL